MCVETERCLEEKVSGMLIFEILHDESEGYWWRLTDDMGRSVAYSAQSFTSRTDCERNVGMLKSLACNAAVEGRNPTV